MDGFSAFALLLRFRALVSFLIIVAVWQLVAALGLAPEKYFPGIPAIVSGFLGMVANGELAAAEWRTLLRAMLGLAGASLLGVGLAILSDISPAFRRGFAPIAAEILYVAAQSSYPYDPRATDYKKLTRPIWPRVADPWAD